MTDNVVAFPTREKPAERDLIQIGEQSLIRPETRYEYLMVARAVLSFEDYQEICVGVLDHTYYDKLEPQLRKVVDSYYSFPT